ncbi:MAG: hypothetical protein II661_02410 [Bacteroidales bacterium]|nr:hypothetical protein [Bacteroidales bacterium]
MTDEELQRYLTMPVAEFPIDPGTSTEQTVDLYDEPKNLFTLVFPADWFEK